MPNSETVFQIGLSFVLKEEGGLSNDPSDSGGLTNHGITNFEYQNWRQRMQWPQKDVSTITSDEVECIYQHDFWNPIQGDNLASDLPRLAVVVFDWSVNHGPSGAIKDLQRCVGAVIDGNCGPNTLAAVRAFVAQPGNSEWVLCRNFDAARKAWYAEDVQAHASQRRFLNGWDNRIAALENFLSNVNFS
ncbi:MAG: hypothetical protein KGJ13_07950 [Patescibacteria group bacterium]|nr:hypothetical protein [Patescibacteria group bacterium]